MICRFYNQDFDPADGHQVHYDNATFVWCPVCLAHGDRKLHLVTDTWQPGFMTREAASGQTLAATLEANV